MVKWKWYRKLCGGVWHRNRYIYNAGTIVIFRWERTKGHNIGGYGAYLVETEDYRKNKSEFQDVLDDIDDCLKQLERINNDYGLRK